jgi:hypothetical protein
MVQELEARREAGAQRKEGNERDEDKAAPRPSECVGRTLSRMKRTGLTHG